MKIHSGKSRRSRKQEPLEVNLTMRVNFGDAPGDAITVIDDKRVPMVDSVFANREKILRGMVFLMLKAGVTSTAVTREIFPVIRLLNRQ